jgi:hypothetical protein
VTYLAKKKVEGVLMADKIPFVNGIIKIKNNSKQVASVDVSQNILPSTNLQVNNQAIGGGIRMKAVPILSKMKSKGEIQVKPSKKDPRK